MPHSTPEYDEQQRVKVLRDLKILDTPCERGFDGVAEGLAKVYGAPIALVTFVDEDRQFFKAAVGTDVRETSLELSFCRHAIQSDEVLVVPDATLDGRFARNPLVTGKPGIRFYAGAPIITSDLFRLGAVCVLDVRPREPDSFDVAVLRHVARLVAIVLEHRKAGSAEPLEFPPFRSFDG